MLKSIGGPIPPELGNLRRLRYLGIGSLALTTLPPGFGNLASLDSLSLYAPALTVLPPELGNLERLRYLVISSPALTTLPPEFGNLERLEWLNLYSARALTTLPPEFGNLERLRYLQLRNSALTTLPPEFGNLERLKWLNLYGTALTALPPEFGNLASLDSLDLSQNRALTTLPPEFGNLERLKWLNLYGTALTALPPEFGNLERLKWLNLDGTALTALPPEFGNLASLDSLDLSNLALTGPLHPEWGNLASLAWLDLSNSNLTGPLPPEWGNLASLAWLDLSNNPGLRGVLPGSLTNLHRLRTFAAAGTGLCAPDDPAFLAWLDLRFGLVSRCGDAVYLTQAVQSLDRSVPLVAGEEALLRVFVTAPANPDSVPLPPVRARFYVDGTERHVEEISSAPHPIPAYAAEDDLAASVNAAVSGGLVRPGLEVVIEIDPDSTLDPSLGVVRRIPAEGRMAVEVREVPVFDLTIIPFLWTEAPDSSLVGLVEAMGDDPQNHEELRMTADLLPVKEMRVTAHAPVETSSNSVLSVLRETGAIQAMEGGTGHWMGMLPYFSDYTGAAWLGGKTSASLPAGYTISHELGHNFSLAHAPSCGGAQGVDPDFPDQRGRIGAWGYAVRGVRSVRSGELVSGMRHDLMSYCRPAWISPYHFTKALQYRLSGVVTVSARRDPVPSLLLWGGTDAEKVPHLEPVFVVDAPPLLPDARGPWTIEGRDAGGAVLFSLAFDMPEIADAGEGAGSFAYTLPVRPGWEALASVTLSGPGGAAILDGSTDRPVSIYRDGDGGVRAILQGDPVQADGVSGALADVALDVVTSRGIPSPAAWRR